MTRDYVRYSRLEMTRAMDDAEARLIDRKAPVYQQNGALVQLIRLNARTAEAEASSTGIKRHPGALLVHPVNPHRLLEIFVEHVEFAIWDGRKGRHVPGAPPLEFARYYDARGMWNLRVLAGIVEAPTLRPDGTILNAPGYDEETGLYLDTGGALNKIANITPVAVDRHE